MKKRLPVLVFFAASALWAQSGEFWFTGGGSILANHDIGSPLPNGPSNDVQLGNGYRLGFRFGLNSAGHIGHEIQCAYNQTKFVDHTGTVLPDPGSANTGIFQCGYNVLYYLHATKENPRVRPFFTGGAHFSDFTLPGSVGLHGSNVRPGGNLGGGVKVRLSTLFGLRLDLREYITGKPNWNGLLFNRTGLLYQTEISAGFGVYF